MAYESSRISGKFKRELEGIITQARRRYKQTPSDEMRRGLERFMTTGLHPCDIDQLLANIRALGFQIVPDTGGVYKY